MAVATLDEALQNVAKTLGVPADKIQTRKNAFNGMAGKMGVFCKEHIRHERFSTTLTEDDLGIKLSKKEKQWVKLGNQILLPPDSIKEVENAENRGRHNVHRHALNVMMGHWVPVTAWDSFQKENEALKKEFFAARDKIVRTYPKLMEEVREVLADRATDVYGRLEKKPDDRRKFIDGFVERVMGRAATAEQVQASFSWDIDLEWLPAPSTEAEEQVRLDKARLERERISAEQNKLRAEERVRWAADRDLQRKLDGINQKYVEQERKKREELSKEKDSFLGEVYKQLRQRLYDSARATLISLKRNDGKLLGSNVKSLQTTIEQGRMLNFMEDKAVENYYTAIEKMLDKDPEDRKIGDIKKKLTEIETEMGLSVRAISSEATKEEELCRIIGQDLVEDVRTIE